MGQTCCSQYSEIKEELYTLGTGIFKKQICNIICKRCGTEHRAERRIGTFTQIPYSGWSLISKNSCEHEYYEVQENTIEKRQESTLGGTFLRLFMGPNADGIQYHTYAVAYAKCKRCQFQFVVRSEFHTEKRDYGKTKVTVYDGWKPIMIMKSKEIKVLVYQTEL